MLGLILAAGAGRRMGGRAKALLELPDRRSFLQAIVEVGRAAGIESWTVVIGEPFSAEVASAADALGLRCAVNPHPERGMASSVAVGFRALERSALGQAAVMWPVDTPGVRRSTVERLRVALGDMTAAIPSYRGRGGHPVVVHRRLWDELAHCEALPQGARSVFAKHRSSVVRVEVDDPFVVVDVDRAADLEQLRGGLC